MADNFKYVQTQPYTLAGSGALIGDTTLILSSFDDIDDVALTMTDFGTTGFGTLEPGNSSFEEQICWTGVTQNADGTATLTGVKNVGFKSPYTQTSGLLKSHAGGTQFVVSNTAGFYDKMTSKSDDETIAGVWTFTDPNVPRMDTAHTYLAGENEYFATKRYVDGVAVAGAPNADATTKGIVQEATQAQVEAGTAAGSTGAELYVNPAKNGAKLYYGYAADAGASDTYAVTLSPVPTAYTTGMVVNFKANTANTGACTLNLNTLGAKSLKVFGADPTDSYITASSIVQVIYDGTNFQILSVAANSTLSGEIKMYGGASAPSGYLLCDGTSYLRATYANLFTAIGTTYGTADGTHFNVPDMRGRVPVGTGTGTGGGASGTGLPAGGTALTARAMGAWVGEETHVLTVGELAAHHHSYTVKATNVGGGGFGEGNGSNGTTPNTNDTGSDTAHNTMQPVMTVNFIIHI